MPDNSNILPPRIALCLSGGGLRATLFHLGSLRRLNEFGLLSQITTFCSVSGGSITNGVLATRWAELKASEAEGVFRAFNRLITQPLEAFCAEDLRTEVLLWDRVNPVNWPQLLRTDYSVTDRLGEAYARALGLGVPLATLPESPEFVFCATNLERGACWRFKAREMGDYDVGWGPTDKTTVAYAVAASSAYPVAFPPLRLKLDHAKFKFAHNTADPNPETVTLTDGGVYDNMGIEPVRDGNDYLLVSDASRPLGFVAMPEVAPYGRVSRSLDVIWNQVAAQRKRWLIDTYQMPSTKTKGAYWGLASKVSNYGLVDASGYSPEVLIALNEIRTDLDSFTAGEIACLENHGYALANAAARRWLSNLLTSPNAGFGLPFKALFETFAALDALKHSSKRGVMDDLWNSLSQHGNRWL